MAEKQQFLTFVEEYHDVQDKSQWGDGPWQREPDKAVWVDDATGLDCMVNRGPMGSWCGYVGVGPDHPWHGKGYNECAEHGQDCEDRWDHRSPDCVIDVHGGLTFADGCAETDDPSKHVCHIPQKGRPTNVWWFGFDCAHAWDVVPRMEADDLRRYQEAKAKGDAEGMRLWGYRDHDKIYRALPYVVGQVRSMATQIAEAARA